MQVRLAMVEKTLAQFSTHCVELSSHQLNVEKDIHKSFEHLHKILEIRKKKLISQLHTIIQDRLKDVAVQRDIFETLHAQISTCVSYIKESLETSDQMEALTVKPAIVKQVTELTVKCPQDSSNTSTTEAGIIFSTTSDLITACQNHGKLISLDLSKCRVAFNDVKTEAGVTSTAIFQAIDCNGQPYEEPIDTELECELVSDVTGTRAKGIAERIGQSQYKLSYQPTSGGKHSLHIKVAGQHIRGSPLVMLVGKAPFVVGKCSEVCGEK